MANSSATNDSGHVPVLPVCEFDPGFGKASSVHYALDRIHADGCIKPASESRVDYGLVRKFLLNLSSFLTFLLRTWGRVALSFPTFILDPIGGFTIVLFAFLASSILGLMLVVTTVLTLPGANEIYRAAIGAKGRANNVSTINAAFPQIFQSLQDRPDILRAAYESMSEPIGSSQNRSDERSFDLEVSKVLLACSALVYERRTNIVNVLADVKSRLVRATHRIDATMSTEAGRAIQSHLGSDTDTPEQQLDSIVTSLASVDDDIREVAASWGLEYHSLSELSSSTSSVCGAFWSEAHNFIILAFKGTNPLEYAEWAIDLEYAYADGSRDLGTEYGGVHHGFLRQLFPSDMGGHGMTPYDEIRKSVIIIAQYLAWKNRDPVTNEPKKVQVWTTGHSLGAGVSSLFYARATRVPKDFRHYDPRHATVVRNVCIRDAYVFGTPVTTDPRGLRAFNANLKDNLDRPRMLWRVTNGFDAVAKLLPSLGDYSTLSTMLSPVNQWNYTHLGQEVQMRDAPHLSRTGPGTHLTTNFPVHITSKIREGLGVGPTVQLSPFHRAVEYVPVVGFFISHGASWYWRSLSMIRATRIQDGHAEELQEDVRESLPYMKTTLWW